MTMYSRLNNKQQPFMNTAYSNYTLCMYHFTETGCRWIVPLSYSITLTYGCCNEMVRYEQIKSQKKVLYYQKTNLWKECLLRRVPYDDSMSNRKSIKPYNLSADVPYPLKKPLGLQFVYVLDIIICRLRSIIYKNLYSQN